MSAGILTKSGVTWGRAALVSVRFFTITGALLIFAAAAAREYTAYGACAAFLLLTAIAISLATLSRYAATTLLCISASLLLIDTLDAQKYRLLRQHLHYRDFEIFIQLLKDADPSLFLAYGDLAQPALLYAVIFIAAVTAAAIIEKRHATPVSRSCLALSIVAICGVALGASSFTRSQYMKNVKKQTVTRMAAERGPLRASVALAGFTEALKLASNLERDRSKNTPVPIAAHPCPHCPDVVFVHLESVYDPSFETAFSSAPAFADTLPADLHKWHTLMRVNTWGGNSVITEFEILCSISHTLFGWSGAHPHSNIGPYIHGCLGNELVGLGYTAHALYSYNRSFASVKAAFENYGLSDFADARALELPTLSYQLRDSMMYAKLIERLERPRDKPRFYWISTNWNHGPHGVGLVKDNYAGPYDAKQADSPELADYVNRLNDSIGAVTHLIDYVRKSNHPTVLVLFGDHHPAFRKHFSPKVIASMPDIDYVTPVIMLRNFAGPALEAPPLIRVEQVAWYMNRFSGVPQLERVNRIHDLEADCGHVQSHCPAAQKSALRAIQLQ